MLSLVTVFTCIIVVMFFIGCNLYAAAYLVYCVQAHIYANEQVDPNRSVSGNVSICSAFLANIDEHKSVSVRIFGKNFDLPPWSVSILPDCQNVAFNTAKVKSLFGMSFVVHVVAIIWSSVLLYCKQLYTIAETENEAHLTFKLLCYGKVCSTHLERSKFLLR